MKLLSLTIIGMLMGSSAFAVEKEIASCQINRSVSLGIVTNTDDESGATELKLIGSHFASDETVEVATAQPGAYGLVRYGKNLVLLINQGRSGYAMIDIKDGKDGKPATGKMDINLFNPAAEGFNTNGIMKSVICTIH